MIARYHLLLPFEFTLAADLVLPPLTLLLKGERLVVHAPMRAQLDPRDLHSHAEAPLGELPLKLIPAPPSPSFAVTVDGRPTVLANLLLVDVMRSSFERLRATPFEELADPPLELAVEAANELIRRIRTLARASNAKLLDPDDVLWLLTYLKDDGSPVATDPLLYRERWAAIADWKLIAITPALWTAVTNLQPKLVEAVWDDLLLDADALFPENGPAVVLAHSALETFTRTTLERLAEAKSTPDILWKLLFRDGREPKLDVQLDELLKMFCGHSLKERNDLWEAYRTLKKARNSYAHQGRPMVDDRPVTRKDLTRLLAATRDIIDWIEALLPEAWRRPSYVETARFVWDKPTFGDIDGPVQAKIDFSSRGPAVPRESEMP